MSADGTSGDLPLRRPEVQRAYREAADANGVRLGGVALDVLNQVPSGSDPRKRAVGRPTASMRTAALNVRVILLAVFERGDVRNDRRGAGGSRASADVSLPRPSGLAWSSASSRWLNAGEHLRILDAVGSRNVQVYYDVANATQMGHNVTAEIRQLSRDRHLRVPRQGKRLPPWSGTNRLSLGAQGDGRHRLHRLIQIKGAVPKGKPMIESYVENVRFMRVTFG